MEWIGDLERAFAATIYPNRIVIGVVAVAALGGLLLLARRRRWGDVARLHPRGAAAIVIPVLAIALPLGWYLASPLVLSKTIDEPAPVVIGGGGSASASPTANPSAPAVPSPSPSATPTPTSTPLARSGEFTGADDFHFGRGTAQLLETAPGVFVVRLADFAVRNGPDLHVYLSPADDGYADGVIELGPLKADKGNQNYEVPPGVDPTSAGSVVIWCKQFSVLFATAPLDS